MYSVVTIVDNVLCCVSCSVVSDSLQPHGLYSLLGSSVHGILQARILQWVAMPAPRGSSWPRDRTRVSISCTAGRFFTAEPLQKPHASVYRLTNMMFIPLPLIISMFSKAFCLIWSGNICVTGISIWKPQFRKMKPPKVSYPRSLNFSA